MEHGLYEDYNYYYSMCKKVVQIIRILHSVTPARTEFIDLDLVSR